MINSVNRDNETRATLQGQVSVVIRGMSAPGTPGTPHFSLDVGEIVRFKPEQDANGDLLRARASGMYDYASHIPEGIHKGWLGIKNGRIPDGKELQLRDGKIQLIDFKTRQVMREGDFSELKDLKNTMDTHGAELSRDDASKVIRFLNEEGEFAPELKFPGRPNEGESFSTKQHS